MTRAQEVLQNVAEEREVRDHIESLNRPIRIPIWSLACLLSQGGLAILGGSSWGQSQANRTIVVLAIVIVALFSIGALIRALHSRDRMWRAVIRREVPELYGKIHEDSR